MLHKISGLFAVRMFSIVLASLFYLLVGNATLAQDGGPSQPEVHSFEPIGTNQMVDLFTGDFTYNIPLFNLPGPDGGYPINLAYHSGIQMEQEASWVGLGWNINLGTINRQVRNLPDDFGGSGEDKITIKTDMRPNWTVGVGRKFNTEIFGNDILDGSLGTTLRLYYNNYRGIGYSVNVGFDLSAGKKNENGIMPLSGDLGFNVKLDSQEGISSSVSLGVSVDKGNTKTWSASAGTGYNSRTGWQRDLTLSGITSTVDGKSRKHSTSYRGSSSASSTLSFANYLTNMSVPYQMRGGNGSFSIGFGPKAPGILKKSTWSIDCTVAKMKYQNQDVIYSGVGYMYYQNSPDILSDENHDLRIKDISRENESMIHKDTRRLGTPIQSYDVYSVTGQGIGNMFRPHRNEIITNTDPRSKSEFHGGNFGFETSTTGVRLGFDIGYNYSSSRVDFWPNSSNAANFQPQQTRTSLSNSIYFQNYGEHSVDDIAGNYGNSLADDNTVVFGLRGADDFYNIDGEGINIKTKRTETKKRALGVEAFTNNLLLNTNNSTTVIPEFDISYYGTPSSVHGYEMANLLKYHSTRASRPTTHVGGYIATNTEGLRYVYGLPVYNNKERDVTFSVEESVSMLNDSHISSIQTEGGNIDYKKKGTDQFFQSTEKSKYAHSYMLTSILGNDYVDYDNVAGPSDGDLGYWVKMNYTKVHTDFKWRSPYNGAVYNKGYENSFKDGKGHYQFGEKEVWYVATVETKTHIAEFIISPRKDALEIGGEINTGSIPNSAYFKLDRIDVYAKSERYPNGQFNGTAKPVKSCHFVYDYSLCTGIPNNLGHTDPSSNVSANQGGKLTLKSFYFTYRNNSSGASRPYEFEYNTNVGGQTITYNRNKVDRWGNYQPIINSADNIDYPYNDPYTLASEMSERAGLWSMKAINLPSGGRYEVDYESDSYAYVQNEVAMHMFKIVSLDHYGASGGPTGKIVHDKVAQASEDNADYRKVYFKLEEPLSSSQTLAQLGVHLKKYIRPDEYIYFKVKINMTKNADSKDYVAGYVRVSEVGIDGNSNVGGFYQWGYIKLDFMHANGKVTNFHPFTEAGARHLRYNQPDLIYDNPANADKDQLSKSDIKNAGYSLISVATDVVDIFKEFTAMMYGNGDKRLNEIELGKSYVRLRTPDKIKYGGGHRVKEVRVIDNWVDAFLTGDEASSTYGTVYDYHMEENGRIISSGVAAYEPIIGGDEIPLRNPIKGWGDKNILSKNVAQTYTEEPGNESLFPGPTVGYRQVRVMSKNTSEKMANPTSQIAHYSGVTINEFYTAKDYPVIQKTSELEKNKTLMTNRVIVPALIVNIDLLRMAASQGYYIELNDMHGKPRGAREIGFDDQGNEVDISKVNYDYFDTQELITNKAGETLIRRRLNNTVDVIFSDKKQSNPAESDISQSVLATEIEFIPETRFHESTSLSAGLEMNFEAIGFIPAFYPIPNFSYSKQKSGTVVTNKIVSKGGILKKTTATQRGSTVETENLAFDQYTGQPLLTSITTDYHSATNAVSAHKIYGYSIMAYDQYEGTGPAYKNIGTRAVGSTIGSTYSSNKNRQHFTMSFDGSSLFPGDVIVATPVVSEAMSNQIDNNRSKVICRFSHQIKDNGVPLNDFVLETNQELNGTYAFTVVRSGRRNLLSLPISTLSASANPTKNRTIINCADTGPKGTRNLTMRSMDNVLSINAVELGQKWYKDTRQLSDVSSDWYDDAFYSKGMSGVFSPIRSYVYVDDRTQTKNGQLTEVNLKNDGVMNGVRLFDWSHILASGIGCENNWKESSQITLKNASSFDIESRNAIGVYSAKLYGRSGTEAIAVAGNAKNTEIGFESFEEYSNGALAITANATNNLNFYSTIDNTNRSLEDRFTITSGYGSMGEVDVFPELLNEYSDFVLRIHVDGFNSEAEEVLTRALLNVGNSTQFPGKATINVVNTNDWNIQNYGSRKWRGELYGRKNIPNYPTNLTNPVVVSDDKAHTGSKSIKVTASNGTKFLQERLTLIPGNKYQVSGWFSCPNNVYLLKNYDNLFASQMQLEFFDMDGNLVSNQVFTESDVLQGHFIDEWQKFTLNFTMPIGAHYVSINLPNAQQVHSNKLGIMVQAAYYDDIRVQPLDGGMQTYVYNQENQRLEAVLDGNNYATFYFYDDEGSLFLIKRETEKGIVTVQESRQYIKKSNP